MIEFDPELRPLKLKYGIDYIGEILSTNDFLEKVDLRSHLSYGSFYASAPTHLDLQSSKCLEFGFLQNGLSLSDRLPAFTDLHIALLDPFFHSKNLNRTCTDTAVMDTAAGVWQIASSDKLACCYAACNYFFPMMFLSRNHFNFDFHKPDKEMYLYAVNSSSEIIIDAFDNDGFVLWRKDRDLGRKLR